MLTKPPNDREEEESKKIRERRIVLPEETSVTESPTESSPTAPTAPNRVSQSIEQWRKDQYDAE